MRDQGPVDDEIVNSVANIEPSKPERGSAPKVAVIDHDQMSFLTKFAEEERVFIEAAPGIESSHAGPAIASLEDGPGADYLAQMQLMERFPSLLPLQDNRQGTIRDRFVAMLNQCLTKGRVPRGRDRTKINRQHFADALDAHPTSIVQQVDILTGYEAVLEEVEPLDTIPDVLFRGETDDGSESELSEIAKAVLQRYPELRRHQFYSTDSTPAAVVALLNGQIVGGTIERSRGGKISRLWLTEQLGFSKTAANNYIEIILDYEKAIGGVESAHESKIPGMRLWLDKSMANGTLETRDQKFSRKQIFKQFGLPNNSLIILRYPRVAALFDEYDARIVDTGYQPRDSADKIAQLEVLLADGPEIGKDGRTYNRQALDKALGLPLSTVLRSPYIDMILKAETELWAAIETDPFISTACGRIFKFGHLTSQGWSTKFVLRLKESFERHYRSSTKDSAKTYYAACLDLLTHISESTSTACVSLRGSIAAGMPVKHLERGWTMVTQEYRDSLKTRYENVGARNTKLGSTNSILRNFGNDGVLPPLALKLVQFRVDNQTHLRSVAEVTPQSGPKVKNPHVDEYLKFATSMLSEAAVTYQVEMGTTDQSDFNKVLRAELERHEPLPGDTAATVILRVLERRLQLLEDAAVALVDTGRTDWEHGQALIARGVDPGDDWDKIINVGQINKFDRGKLLRKYFPHEGASREQGIANLLTVVVSRYDSQYPANAVAGRPEGQFFPKRALEFGGAKKLQNYISPPQSAVAAVATLYQLASGGNVSVARGMHFECIEASEEPRHSKVTGYKSRAGGKPIFVTLEDRSPAIRGMKWLQEACATGRLFAGEDHTQLFISRAQQGGGFKMIEEWTYRAEFKALVASIPELADLPLTPNMLRPSILLRAVLQSDGRTRLSMALGQHGQNVHTGYTDKFPTRLLRDLEIRRFTHSYETLVIQKADEAMEFLGVSAESFERRVEAVMKTGLGTMCADRNGRPGNDGEICTTIDCWNDCPQLIVIARPRDIAILRIWQHSLREVEGDWFRDRPERWGQVWLPWLAFVDAVEIKMRQPAFLKVWEQAGELAQQFRAQPNFQPMRLF